MNCPDCQRRSEVVKTVPMGFATYRERVCKCGVRFQTKEEVLVVTGNHGQPPVTTGNAGQPRATARNGPQPPATPRNGGGVGGGLSSGPIRQESDPIPGSVDSPIRGRARRKPPANYPADFDRDWALTAKTGSKFDAFRAWERLGRPVFGGSWLAWTKCSEWQQHWFNYPHVSSWLNDGRYQQDPAESTAKPQRQAVPIAVAQEQARRQRINDERFRRITEELKPREERPSPRQEFLATGGGK